MKTLHKLYNLSLGDTRYKSKLKKCIISKFGDQIYFLSSNTTYASEVIVSSEYFQNQTHSTRDKTVKSVSQMLKEDVIENFKDVELTSWPPSTKELATSSLSHSISKNTFVDW